MSKMRITDELITTDEQKRKELKSKMSILMAETYKLLKMYASTFTTDGVVDSDITVTLNKEMFDMTINVNREKAMAKCVGTLTEGIKLTLNAEFDNEPVVNQAPRVITPIHTMPRPKDIPAVQKPVKEDNKSLEIVRNIMKDLMLGVDKKVIAKRYKVDIEAIDRICTQFNIKPPVKEEKKINLAPSEKQHAERGVFKKRADESAEQIMHDLAVGKMMQKDIAIKYQVVPSTISTFKREHIKEIEALKKHLAEEKIKKEEEAKKVEEKKQTQDSKASTVDNIPPNIDPDLEAMIIQDLIKNEPVDSIAVKYKLKDYMIRNIANFNHALIMKGRNSQNHVPRIDTLANNGGPASMESLQNLQSMFAKR